MRSGKEGKLKVKVTRDGSGPVARSKDAMPGGVGSSEQPLVAQVLSDEEMAWRLHQELNATSPMLRTRSRKAPDLLAATQSLSDPAQRRKGQASGSQEDAGVGKGQGSRAPTRSVNKSSQPAANSGADSHAREEQLEGGASDAGPDSPLSDSLAQQAPEKLSHSPVEGMRAAAVVAVAVIKGEAGEEALGAAVKSEQLGDEELGAVAGSAREAKRSDSIPAVAPEAPAGSDDAPAPHHGSSPPSSAAQQQAGGGTASTDRAAVRGHGEETTSSAEEEAAGAAAAAPAPRRLPAATDSAAEREEQQAEGAGEAAAMAGAPAAGGKPRRGGKGGRQPKIPKLPMVRQEDGRWYRARLLKDAGDKVSLEFTGFESQFPPIWLPRDCDRIWRGSYKGKDWKHLGGGAWEPKCRNGGAVGSSKRGGGRGGKRKRGERKGSEDAAHSSGDPAGDSHDHEGHFGEEEHSDEEEGFDEAESGHGRKLRGAAGTAGASGGGAAGVKEEAGELGQGLGGSVGGSKAAAAAAGVGVKSEGEQQQHGEEEGGHDGEEVARPRKKAKRNTQRKRLDPIVREALMAAEQGPPRDDWEDQAGPSNQSDGQATPLLGWKGAWKRHHRAAAAAAAQHGDDAAMGDAEEGGGGGAHAPHLTPTPETPATRLGKRMSLTPGGPYQPLSPRAGAAAAAAIDAAASPRHQGRRQAAQQQQQLDDAEADAAPVSPRRRGRAHGADWAASGAASPRAAAGEAGPLSPRHHRLHSRAAAAAADEEGGESGDGGAAQERGLGRRSRRQQHHHRSHDESDSDAAADGTGTDSQEEQLPKARPKRQSRKAAIYKDADFAFGEEAEEAADAAAAAALAVEPPSNQDGTQPAAPARRRRKPLVSSPAPTDMCMVVSTGKGCSALPAPLAALDVLPPPPPPVATAERPLGAAEVCIAAGPAGAAAAAVGGVDAAEAEAVAALADMPSPRAAGYLSQQLLLHHRHRQGQLAVEEAAEFAALEEEEAGEGEGEDDGDDDYAPPVRRQPLALATEHSGSMRRRTASATLPLTLGHIRTGRVHKLHGDAAPFSRHLSLAYGDRAGSSGRRGGSLDPAGGASWDQHQQHRGGRRGSLGFGEGLDGITAAQGMFGTIFSALKNAGLDELGDGASCGGLLNGLNGAARRGGGDAARGGPSGLLQGLEALGGGVGGGANGAPRAQLHLFSSAWSYSKWHSYGNGEQHPSILSIQPDLFAKACSANSNGNKGLFSLEPLHSAAHLPLMHCASSKPPLPLFC